MIKVEKDLNSVPDCLKSGKAYNCEDVKIELKKVYNKKCCYCETKLTKNYAIEHFRPKQDYKWLEKSWSNLLLVCNSCNSSKGKLFEVANTKQISKITGVNVHNSAKNLNQLEEQYLLHPEYDNPEDFFAFEKSGKIKSIKNNKRAEYTIYLVKLNHTDLIEARYEIIEKFIKELKNKVENSEIANLIFNFAKESEDKNLSFTAFRKYTVKNHLLKVISDIK